MNSIAPIWDGNETWLVLGGVGLLAAFPLAFAIILPAVYFPMLVDAAGADLPRRRLRVPLPRRTAPHLLGPCLLLRLGDRDVRAGHRARRLHPGFQTTGRQFSGGTFDCFTPFSLLTGFALLFGYALLGAGWLVLKTEGALQDWARRHGRRCLVGVVVAVAVVSLWTPLMEPTIARRWFSWPNIALLSPVPIVDHRDRCAGMALAAQPLGSGAVHRRRRCCSRCPISASPSACCR